MPLLAQQELVTNGSFKRGLQKWEFFDGKAHKGKATPKIQRVDGLPTFTVDVPAHKATNGVSIHQEVEALAGKTYMLSVACRIEGTGFVVLKLNQNEHPWDHYGCKNSFKPTGEWRRYVAIFKVSDLVASKPPGVRITMAGVAGKVFLRDVSFKQVPDREIPNANGWFKAFGINEEIPINAGGKSPKNGFSQGKAEIEEVPPQAAKPTGTQLTAAALIARFAENAAQASIAYQGRPLSLSGRVTSIEPALLGDILLELEDGRVSILLAGKEISSGQKRFIQAELASATRQVRLFARVAEKNKIQAGPRKAREALAYPTVQLTAEFVGYRNGRIKFRRGSGLRFMKGETLVAE